MGLLVLGEQWMRVLMGGNTAGLSLDFLPLLLLLVPNPPHLRESWAWLVPRLLRPAPQQGHQLQLRPKAACAGGTRGDLQAEGRGLYSNKKQPVELALYG